MRKAPRHGTFSFSSSAARSPSAGPIVIPKKTKMTVLLKARMNSGSERR